MANQETGRSRSISLRRLEAERPRENGWQEPYELRGSRTVVWGTGGETPPVYPAGGCNCDSTETAALSELLGDSGGTSAESVDSHLLHHAARFSVRRRCRAA